MEYSEQVCSDLLRESASTGAEELPSEEKEVTLEDIAQYSSVSEYSNFLLSKILNDAGLNGVTKDLEDTFVMSRNSRNFLEMQGIEGLADTSSLESSSTGSSRTSDEISCSNRISGVSLASTLSAISDGSNDSDLSVTPTVTVTESGERETCYDFPSSKDENSSTDVAAVVKPYRNNGGLESIQEVSDTTENDDAAYADDSDNSSVKSDRKKPFYVESGTDDVDQNNKKNSSVQCNGKVHSERTHASVQGTNSWSSTRSSNDFSYEPRFVCSRKESTVSTQSGESNPDDDEERDVISEFKKREEKLTAYGSSLRLNMGNKKV